MNARLKLDNRNDFVADIQRSLEKLKLVKDQIEEDELKRRIPKLYKRPLLYLQKRQPEFYNKKTKKAVSKNSLQDSLLNLDEQFKINQNLIDLQDKLGVSIIQKNGQRKLGGPPPGWEGPPPGPGCEIFVGRIPRNIYEDVIYPVFSQIGDIYEMRLMMNFSGTNRGFCFIMYVKPELAQRAIRELNNYQIRPGWFIGVVESVNNCRLHVTDLPSQTDSKKLIQKIWPVCEDVDKISVFTNINNNEIKHALISFKTHRSAAMARRRLLPERNDFFDKSEVRIEWAHPKISITNVIEETGFCNEKGEIIMSRKIVGTEKKRNNEDNVKHVPSKNIHKKKSVQNTFRRNSSTKIMRNEENEHLQIPSRQNNLIISTNNNMQPCNINRCTCEQDFCINDNFDGHMTKAYDDFKYSMRSDESLSDLSKNSDSDDSRIIYYHPNNNITLYNRTPAFLNPSNCSVVNYPWKLSHGYSPNEILNMHHQNTNLYHVPFPWGTALTNFNANKIHMQSQETFNCTVPMFYNTNNFNNVGNIRFYEMNRCARPILNRNLSSS